jgi:Permease family
VAAGVIMIVLGLLPKMAALVESVPTFVLGGAGLVMFGMVAATGIRILANVDFKSSRNNLYIVAMDPADGARAAPAARERHPADRDLGGATELLLQRRQGRRSERDRSREGGRGALTARRGP